MRYAATFIAVMLALALPSAAQIDDQRWKSIREKHNRGEKITEEERDYYESKVERKNQTESAEHMVAWAKEHPARESTGMTPLPDLGGGMYKGEQGGLYPGGSNQPP